MFEVLQREHVLSAEQCVHVIEAHRARLEPSTVGRPQSIPGPYEIDPSVRSSLSAKLPALRADIAAALSIEIASATGATLERVEPWELLHYPLGAYFRRHSDWINPDDFAEVYARGGQRTHSVIVYLCEVQSGGELAFPWVPLLVRPAVGLFVSWPNMHDGRSLRLAAHESLPVLIGEKWALVTWVREHALGAVLSG